MKTTEKSLPTKAGLQSVTKEDCIHIRGARVNNLKNISLTIPRNQFITITGLSGSGKSSLAFDTLYAEGQRRYVESLSAYARQFLGKLDKPDVDGIDGISPAIAIEQKVSSKNPRSTVGTSTEIYDYLKLLYARIGTTYSPISGKEVKRHTVTDVVDYLFSLKKNTKVVLCAVIPRNPDLSFTDQLQILLAQGFTRLMVQGKMQLIENLLEKGEIEVKEIDVIVDRCVITTESDQENRGRVADSVQTAFYEGNGTCSVLVINGVKKGKTISFSNRFELDGITFEKPSVQLFSFNNPFGACKECGGFGSIIGIDEDLVIPNKGLSIYDNAVVCWRGEKMIKWKNRLIMKAEAFDFPIHKPYVSLTENQKNLLWKGNDKIKGINSFFKYLEKKSYKIQYRVMLSRYRGKTKCPECRGTRLKEEVNYIKIGGKTIVELVVMPLDGVLSFFQQLELEGYEREVSDKLVKEIVGRLDVLGEVGLGYLTLNRLSNTLSGGESQRINLATSLGSTLVGSLYILDEPSIGLHPRDTEMLIGVLKKLKRLGNTVIVVEHDEDIMRASDQIIDLGPMAGLNGGYVVFQGGHEQMKSEKESLTAKYLQGKMKIGKVGDRRPWKSSVTVIGARENNLKSIDVCFPLHTMTVVTGVSGSGKSTLVSDILQPAISNKLNGYGNSGGVYEKLVGQIDEIARVEYINQNPIGKSSRSNPVTYIKAWDDIRNILADQPLARKMGYKPKFFSFNVDGGRCDECKGEGTINIEMQFMADVRLICDDCKGTRFKREIREVKYKGKNVSEILELTVNEGIIFFNAGKSSHEKNIVRKLAYLDEVGMGYVKLGQPSSTLSGGEAQRVKLASFLAPEKKPLTDRVVNSHKDGHTLFIFDEPTTGLHFHDINKLLSAFNALINTGNSIIIIEHNLEIIKNADWVIDLGPEGGDNGGELVFAGRPEDLIHEPRSYTGRFLKEKLS